MCIRIYIYIYSIKRERETIYIYIYVYMHEYISSIVAAGDEPAELPEVVVAEVDEPLAELVLDELVVPRELLEPGVVVEGGLEHLVVVVGVQPPFVYIHIYIYIYVYRERDIAKLHDIYIYI